MVDTTVATSNSCLHVTALNRSVVLGLRVAILILDFATIVTLSVSLGLYRQWTRGDSYATIALSQTKHTDWTDSIALAVVLVSLIWTGFITIRPAWTSKALHLSYFVAFEFLCLVWIVACTVPAMLMRDSDFKTLATISYSADIGTARVSNEDTMPWATSHWDTPRKLQIASYSVACAIG